MTIRVETHSDGVQIFDPEETLTPAVISALIISGFRRSHGGFIGANDNLEEMTLSVFDLLTGSATKIETDSTTQQIIARRNEARGQLTSSCQRGLEVKAGNFADRNIEEFVKFLESGLHRRLLPHQIKAAIHLVSVVHGANFSVPGAGKTSVVLAVYEFLRVKGLVNSLFVVGPRSCFMPWRSEFELTLGRAPTFEILAGGDVARNGIKDTIRSPDNVRELYLTTYQTLSRDTRQLGHLLKSGVNHTYFVADEAHYMKQDNGVWANAVSETSRFAKRRCVLTGTPFPKSYADGINLFDVLHPNSGILTSNEQSRIRQLSELGEHHKAREIVEPKIDSLYYRVRKCDLRLSDPVVPSSYTRENESR